MPDPTPPPTPPTPPAPKQTRGVLDKAQVNELTKAEQIAKAAKITAYATALATREITGAYVDQLILDIKDARIKAADAVQSTTAKEAATKNEENTQRNLIIAMAEVQAAARQKYARTDPTKLADYFIGQKLDESRALLEEYSAGIIDKLATDTLPGITAGKITALGTLREDYVNANATQGSEQSDATDERIELAAMLKSITDRRMTIQFAADAQWPYTTAANAGVRKEFKLPSGQPFNG